MLTEARRDTQTIAFEEARADVIAEAADQADAMLRSLELKIHSLRRNICAAGSVQFVDSREGGSDEQASDLLSEMLCDDMIRDFANEHVGEAGGLDELANPESASDLINAEVRSMISGAVFQALT